MTYPARSISAGASTSTACAGGRFLVSHQASASNWGSGLGGKAGAAGYWLSYVAVDNLTVGGRSVPIGVDYKVPGTPAPTCNSVAPAPTTASTALTPSTIAPLFSVFP